MLSIYPLILKLSELALKNKIKSEIIVKKGSTKFKSETNSKEKKDH
jgi:hypothetical protein